MEFQGASDEQSQDPEHLQELVDRQEHYEPPETDPEIEEVLARLKAREAQLARPSGLTAGQRWRAFLRGMGSIGGGMASIGEGMYSIGEGMYTIGEGMSTFHLAQSPKDPESPPEA